MKSAFRMIIDNPRDWIDYELYGGKLSLDASELLRQHLLGDVYMTVGFVRDAIEFKMSTEFKMSDKNL